MPKHLNRTTWQYMISNVLARRGINPRVQPVPIEVMTPLARDVRQELDRVGAGGDDLDACFDLLVAEVLDKTMTPAGQQMAVDRLAAGFRSKPHLAS